MRDGRDSHGSSFASVEEDYPESPLAHPLPALLLGGEQCLLQAQHHVGFSLFIEDKKH